MEFFDEREQNLKEMECIKLKPIKSDLLEPDWINGQQFRIIIEIRG